MKKHYSILFLLSIFLISKVMAETTTSLPDVTIKLEKPIEPLAQKISDPHFKKTPNGIENSTSPEKKIWFKFKDEPLIDVVHYIANALKINVVLPQGPDVLTTKITFQYPDKVSPEAAYEKLLSFLKITGYSIVPQDDFYYIIKNTNGLITQPFPLYINTPPQDLPDTDQVIRYMYYFANIQVPSDSSGGYGGMGGSGSALAQLLKDTLSPTAVTIVDSSINGMLITDYSRTLKAVMEIVVELDTHGFTDAIEIIQLKHTSATTIANLFQGLINPQSQGNNNQPGGSLPGTASPQANPSCAQYFAQTTRLVAEPRSNSIIIMGKKDALKRIREFTEKYLDVELSEGNSVLHIYPLQYLQAAVFAPILQALVSSQSNGSSVGGGFSGGSTGQSSGTVNPSAGTQYFNGVVVIAEPTQSNSQTNTNSTSSGGTTLQPAQQGGNRLIIAAVEKDWLRVKKLIEDLDKPQPQVALEILIVDLTLTGARVLGSQVRNKENMFPSGVNAQTSMLSPLVINSGVSNTPGFDGLLANLLQLDSNQANMASNMTQGSFVFSVQDNPTTGISWVMQMLNNWTNSRVLSHPFAVSLNNQQTVFTNNETRLLPGNATNKKGGGVFVPLAPVPASLSVTITPLINNDQYINLNLSIVISEFANSSNSANSSAANSQINRSITTNANVGDGQVLVLGGLTKTTLNTTELGTPFLKDIPLIGWMFKKKSTGVIKANLAIFISPKILKSTNGTCDSFTASKLFSASNAVDPESNLAALRDPITRWFFESTRSNATQDQVIDFIERKAFVDKKDYENLVVKTTLSSQKTNNSTATTGKLTTIIEPKIKAAKSTNAIICQKTTENDELRNLFQSFEQEHMSHAA